MGFCKHIFGEEFGSLSYLDTSILSDYPKEYNEYWEEIKKRIDKCTNENMINCNWRGNVIIDTEFNMLVNNINNMLKSIDDTKMIIQKYLNELNADRHINNEDYYRYKEVCEVLLNYLQTTTYLRIKRRRILDKYEWDFMKNTLQIRNEEVI